MDKRTRRQRYEALDEDLEYASGQLDRAVVSTSQIRLVLETFRDRLFSEIFPGRSTVPKTLIFAKDDNHAETLVQQVRQVFGAGNDFAAKITYSAKDPRQLLQNFRNSPTLRVAVTVDMIATGTDVKAIECIFFMRDVRSATYFEQMKGRGARTMPDADFQAVTPDASAKTRFVIVDAVGVTSHEYVDAAPLNREKSASLKQLLGKAAALTITEDEVATLASRLSRLDQQLTSAEQGELATLAGQPVTSIVRGLVDAVDPDRQAAAAASPGDPGAAQRGLLLAGVAPLAGNPPLRQRILEIRASHDVVIDETTVDVLRDAYGVADTERAREVVTSWRDYLDEHRDEIAALDVLYSSAGTSKVTFAELRELAERIKRPPRNWTPDVLWSAYAAVESRPGRVRRADRHTMTDLVSLVRFALGRDAELVPYAETVQERYARWLAQQEQAGALFSERERWWLDRMADVVAQSAGVSVDDLDNAPFIERGGLDGIVADLGPSAGSRVAQLNEALTG
jgi:type I restriction enzyme R subunit